MKHTFFEITNFKGIDSVRLDFVSRPRSNVHTLVGLNESGKTTILEALNFLTFKTERLDPLNLPGYSIKNAHELIPIGKRSNFNGAISIKAGYSLDDEDNERLRKKLRDTIDFHVTRPLSEITACQTYEFQNSQLLEGQPSNRWHLPIVGKRKGARNERPLEGEGWLKAIGHVRSMLPSVLYFPNFLFEFPDKIYLEEAPTQPEKHQFYRTILQDVLDAIDENTHLDTHVLARAKAGGRYDKQALDSVLLKMGSNITNVVFSNWNRIFKRTVANKEITVTYDQEDNGAWFLQLRLKDANELYSISERSLGFRWFFTFLLLTQYRGFRKKASKSVLFLLDEPASNLHPSAQSQLLQSFSNFPDHCSIIYTTHSHHMINPEWLEGTYVVKNEGLDYEQDDYSYNAKNTRITLHKYRDFAGQHPNQSTYFQPVLDVLDYSPSRLENISDVVMVEGKNDFYTLKYFQRELTQTTDQINLLPGGGAGSLDLPIRLYLGWGRNFIVLLDSDKAGKQQKDRYESVFGTLVSGRIFNLNDVNPLWNKKRMEDLVEDRDRLLIQQTAYPTSTQYTKKQFNRAVQELYLVKKNITLYKKTTNNFARILNFCSQTLKGLSPP